MRMTCVALAVTLLAASPSARQVSTAASQSAALQELRDKTRGRLDEIARNLDGVMGYSIVDVTADERFARLDSQVFPTASTIKLGILYELFRQADEGRLRLDEELRLNRARAVPGGILFQLRTPVLSMLDYANLMVIESDNTATNVLIEKLGMAAVTARMAGLGLQNTRLRRYMIDTEAARQGRENVSTPAELARLLGVLLKGEGLKADSGAEAIRILEKEKPSPIRRAVPERVAIASKSGELEGVRADTAIVRLKNRPFIIVAMTNWLADDVAGEAAIQELAHVAYQYFARLDAGSEYGRRLGGR